MPKKNRELAQLLTGLALAGDVIIVLGMLCLAFDIRFQLSNKKVGVEPISSMAASGPYFMLAAALYIGLLANSDIYKSRDLLRFSLVIGKVVSSSFAWIGFVLLGTLLVRLEPRVSRGFLFMAWILASAGLIGWRSIFHSIVSHSSLMAALPRRIAFIGWSERTALLAANIRNDPESAYQVVGFFETGHEASRRSAIVPCLGSIEDFELVFSSVPIDVVVLEARDSEHEKILRVADICERELLELKLIPSDSQILAHSFNLESIGGVPTVGGRQLPLDRTINRLVKRFMDLVGATLLLIITTPVVLYFAGRIHAASPGPVFSRQRRFGRRGKPFNLIKIRTYRLVEARDGVLRKSTAFEDPRIGVFMRKWKIDDLPQFWNVLAGDMSLVGPRPERPDLTTKFKYEIAQYSARHSVKPGVTGWAQVNGRRGNKVVSESVIEDLWYLENWTVFLDLKILFMTIFSLKDDVSRRVEGIEKRKG